MADPRHEGITDAPDLRTIRKEEPTFVHNVRQLLGCLPVIGSAAVGIGGLIAFAIGMGHTADMNQPWNWLIGGSLGLIGSGIGFGVLAWIMWANRQS